MIRGLAARAAFAGLLFFAALSTARAESIEIRSRTIESFQIGRSTTRFGALEFVGGLEMTSRARTFGALSGLRFLDDGTRFVGVADTGNFFFGSVERDGEGRPTGIADFSMEPMLDARGRPHARKREVDAEGIALRGNEVFVSFERDHRVESFRLAPGRMAAPTGSLPIVIPSRELRQNQGLETLAASPPGGPLRGSLVAVAEGSIDKSGNLFAAILEGPSKGIFTVVRHQPFFVTDGAFLPDGDLLLLERSHAWAFGAGMRLRRIPGETIRPGALVDGRVLIETDLRYQIDNMEALDVWTRADGATMVSMMSDDNHSILQRNLYLEFRLVE
ncbi:MAG: hypothetical protein DI629_13905 [Mesorhizobium amorphae]|nr:MAG: hypothetical protein DI629_13905 [Mesorhizobium amorphae]